MDSHIEVYSRADLARRRLDFWRDTYLQSTTESLKRAEEFSSHHPFSADPFSAYLYLFVAFNNLYRFLGGFDSGDPDAIKTAIDRLPDVEIRRIYTAKYVECIRQLNEGIPEQFLDGPDADNSAEGVINLKAYFRGDAPGRCVEHVESVATGSSTVAERKATLGEVASVLLYAVRNNQFHVVKGQQRLQDLRTLAVAYELLRPISDSLMAIANGVSRT